MTENGRRSCSMHGSVLYSTLKIVINGNVTPKKSPSLKSGFCGSIVCDIFWNFENWSTGRLRKCVSFLPPSIGRKVVATVCMVQTVSLLLPVD